MEIIRTPRLVLRTWKDIEVETLLRLNDDPRVTEFVPGPLTLAQAQGFIEARQALQAKRGACYFAATLVDTGEFAGFVGLKRHDGSLPFA